MPRSPGGILRVVGVKRLGPFGNDFDGPNITVSQTADWISRPEMHCSTSTHREYFPDSWTATESPFRSSTRITPIDDPADSGLTM